MVLMLHPSKIGIKGIGKNPLRTSDVNKQAFKLTTVWLGNCLSIRNSGGYTK